MTRFELSVAAAVGLVLSACGAASPDGIEEDTASESDIAIADAGQLVNSANGACMTARMTIDGAAEMSPCTGGLDQKWILREHDTGRVDIVSAATNKCITIDGASQTSGARAILLACSGAPSQLFRVGTSRTRSTLVNVSSGQCLDLNDRSTAPGTRVVPWQCQNTPTQTWTHE